MPPCMSLFREQNFHFHSGHIIILILDTIKDFFMQVGHENTEAWSTSDVRPHLRKLWRAVASCELRANFNSEKCEMCVHAVNF